MEAGDILPMLAGITKIAGTAESISIPVTPAGNQEAPGYGGDNSTNRANA